VDGPQLARRLVVGLEGHWPSARETGWLRAWQPAGVLLFARNVRDGTQLTALCRRLHALLPPGGEIMADHEGGAVSVLAEAIGRPPAPFGLGLLGDEELTECVHAETGRLLRVVGVDRVLAPCADVLSEPRNPVIGARAFGDEPVLVARHVAAAVAGLGRGGVAVCLKHWPGHGGTRTDTHEQAALGGSGLHDEPFAAGLRAGADGVLVGHMIIEEGGGDRPACLDQRILEGARTLGLECGRPGLRLLSDDVTMGALIPALGPSLAGQERFAPPARPGLLDPALLPLEWFLAIAAGGCDLLLCRAIPWLAFPLPAPGGHATGDAEPPDQPAGAAMTGIAAYREARQRLGVLAATATGSPRGRRVLWLDASAGDRWGGSERLANLLTAAAPTLGMSITRVPADQLSAVQPCAALTRLDGDGADRPALLLVTAHRPLAPAILEALTDWLDRERLRQRLSSAQKASRRLPCLALGHPSLRWDLATVLAAAPGYLPDVRAADLAAYLAAAESSRPD
jgi:hypothetical protein